MRAWVVRRPGGPEVLELEEVPDPVAGPGWVHLAVESFGLNRAEAVTRAGGSGDAVMFPRILGIECVGTVLGAPGGEVAVGSRVAAVMGGMGRAFDGSYAEQAVVPAAQVMPVSSALTPEELGAIPETFLTAWGCLHEALEVRPGARVVVRPGASALGRAVTQIVTDLGGDVIGVTRSAHKADVLRASGMREVIVSDGDVAPRVRELWPDGATGVIDTVTSSATIRDDLAMRARGGRVCIAGSLAASSGDGGPGRSVAAALVRPSVRRYSSEQLAAATHSAALAAIVERVESGRYDPGIDRVIGFDEVADAHAAIDASRYCGKVVVATD
ncbi:MAG: zinc-binding dehydrogenase [Actinomycetota bacterium]